jgi:hypothetical protein
MSNKEQTKAESDASDAAVPPAGNEPPGEHTDSNNTTPTGGNEQHPREPHEKRIREWLIVLFTGTIVVGTLYYASIAKRQADLMSQQRDVMIQQVNASQRQTEEMGRQTNTFNDTLNEARKSANAAEAQAKSSEASVGAAWESVQVSHRSLEFSNKAYITVQGANYGTLTLGGRVVSAITFVNAGNTPAYDVLIETYIDLRDKPLPDKMPRPNIASGGFSKSIVPPKGTFDISPAMKGAIDQSQLDALNNETKSVYVWGMITYKDIFKQSRWLKFCGTNQLKTDKIIPCSNNNDAN